MYSLLVVWFYQHAHGTSLATPPVRPWYAHKRGVINRIKAIVNFDQARVSV